jgi:hypothetical protein
MQFFSKQLSVSILLLGMLVPIGMVGQTPASLCQPDEAVLFSCRLEGNSRIVSLCTTPKSLPLQSVAYRYGTASKVELTYTATPQSANRFAATVSPAKPGVTINQVWFETKGTRYVLTECVGGDCAHDGGIIVLRSGRTLMSRACSKDSGNQSYFSSKIIDFESDLNGSHSKTDLIQLKEYDNHIDALYPWK